MLGFFGTAIIILIFYQNMEAVGEEGLDMYALAKADYTASTLSL